MVIDMISNLSLITMFLFFYNQINKRLRAGTLAEAKIRLIIGALHGAGAVLLMYFSVKVSPETIVDMRQIMIISSAFFGGVLGAFITAIMVAIGRVVLFGGWNPSSVTAVFSALALAAGSGYLMKHARSFWYKWTASLVVASLLMGVSLYYLLGSASLAIAPPLMLVVLIGGLFTAALIAFVLHSDKLMHQLHRSERNYRRLHSVQESIFQSAYGVSMIVSDVNGTITRFNRGAELMLGYKADEFVGKGLPYVFNDPEEIALREIRLSEFYGRPIAGLEVYIHRAKNGIPDEGEWTFVRKDGTRLTVNQVITPVMADGEIVGFMGTANDVTERKNAEETLRQANEILQELSFMDGLTGISNRRHFDEVLEKEWRRAERASADTSLSLLMLDIDEFKEYNDTYGHQLGDECLKRVAEMIKDTVRRATDTGARYGGEEFAVILPDTDSEGAVRLAEKLREAIRREAIVHDGSSVSPFVTFSIGTATMTPRPDFGPATLIGKADEALYEAKFSGRNCIRTRDERFVKNVKKSG